MAVTNYYTVNGEIIGEKVGAGARTDYLTDALGSVTATLNQSAQVVNTYRYKPYGALLAKTGVGADPAFQWVGSQGYRQTSKRFSDVYVRARHYDTNTARWTSKDPLDAAIAVLSPYLYAEACPTKDTDPSGLQPPRCPQGQGWQGPHYASTFNCRHNDNPCLSCGLYLPNPLRYDYCWVNPPKQPSDFTCQCNAIVEVLGKEIFATRDDWNVYPCGTDADIMDLKSGVVVTATRMEWGPNEKFVNRRLDLHEGIFGKGDFYVCIRWHRPERTNPFFKPCPGTVKNPW